MFIHCYIFRLLQCYIIKVLLTLCIDTSSVVIICANVLPGTVCSAKK